MNTNDFNYSPQGGIYGLDILTGLSVPQFRPVFYRNGKAVPGTVQPVFKHVYGGTVPAATVATRRTRNKAARKSRRINRLRGA